MHSVTDGATGLRERRRKETSARLATLARRLTAERGLAGFTIEEVCEQAGVSRRTFFNHFASKEDALLGRSSRLDTADLDEAFVAAGDSRDPALSPTLLGDLAELCLARWSRLEIDGTALQDMHAAMRREPGLLIRAIEASVEDEDTDAILVERREGLARGDLRAAAVVQIVAALARASGREYLAPGNSDPIDLILRRRLDAAREVMLPTSLSQPERTP
ncbi:TetR/AcrR family transcriptional regulator [Clavibacter sp. km1a]|uniref:TetR/AcrR family transcriptional regulator n=1 Tax=Clavibacter sp. km1a TaxID=3459136 RepID=UPI0040414255